MFEALRERDFRLLFTGQTISLIGSSITTVALAFAVLEIGSSTDLGIVMGAGLLPLVLFLVVGGVWADRLPRQWVMIVSDLIRFACQAGMAWLLLTHRATMWELIILQFVRGSAEAFFRPAQAGLLPHTVSVEHLQQANALRGLTDSLGVTLGAAFGGVLVAAVGSGWAIGIDALTYLASAAFLWGLRGLVPLASLPADSLSPAATARVGRAREAEPCGAGPRASTRPRGMVLAALRSDNRLGGTTLTCDENAEHFTMQGLGEIAPAKLLDLENRRQLVWADPVTRKWVLETVATRARGTAAAKAAARAGEAAAAAAEAAARERAGTGGVTSAAAGPRVFETSAWHAAGTRRPAGVRAAQTRFEAPRGDAGGARRVVWSEPPREQAAPPGAPLAPGGFAAGALPQAEAGGESGSFLADLRDGWQEFRSRTWLWVMVCEAAVFHLVIIAPLFVLGPFVAKYSLGGAAAWGAILASFGVGQVAGGAAGLRLRPARPLLLCGWLTVLEVPLFAFFALGYGTTALIGAAAVCGIAAALVNVLWETTLQEQIPSEALSRVSAFDLMGSLAFYPLGVVAAGPIAAVIGVTGSFTLASVATFGSAVLQIALPDIRGVRRRGPAPANPQTGLPVSSHSR
jgi:MFS family permease